MFVGDITKFEQALVCCEEIKNMRYVKFQLELNEGKKIAEAIRFVFGFNRILSRKHY